MIVEATGATLSKVVGRAERRSRIEQAMTNAIQTVPQECEAIWARTDIDLDEKNRLIAEVNDPAAIRERMMAARQAAKDAMRAEDAEQAAIDKAEAEEKAAAETAANEAQARETNARIDAAAKGKK